MYAHECLLIVSFYLLFLLHCSSLSVESSTTSLSSLVDMPHQTRIVALLIVNPQVNTYILLNGLTGFDMQYRLLFYEFRMY